MRGSRPSALPALAALLVGLVASTATASPSGRKWFFPKCSPSCPASMQCIANQCVPLVLLATSVDNSGADTINGNLPYSTFLNRAPEAFRNWTGARVTCPASGLPTAWTVTFGPAFSSPQGVTAVDGNDRINAVIWLSGANWRHSNATLGLTTVTFYTGTLEIFDADMELNNNVAWASDGAKSAYDMESVVLHEAGHFLGLDHTFESSEAVMYPDVAQGAIKRALASLDIADVCTVYSSVAGSLGTPCATDTPCLNGLVCEGSPGATTLTCVNDCKSGDTCSAGSTCRASTNGYACLPEVGVPDQCHFCTRPQDCLSGVCLLTPVTGISYCSRTCNDPSQCATGYTCTATDSGSYCLADAACKNQCQNATECAVDYDCTNGTCVPQGKAGDRCEISGFCQACNACVQEGSVSFCRACCGKASSGTTQCRSCGTIPSCSTDLVCTALSSGDSACLAKAAAPGVCEACPSGTCADGLSCVSGRCYAACNPSTPGSCHTCLSLPSGGGAICACPDEAGNLGEPCGIIAGIASGCAFGLFCAGSPNKLCRAQCNANDPSSCQEGEACQLVDGHGVCVPGTSGSACAPCNSFGSCDKGLSCYNGRCYTQCNTSLGTACRTCVQTQADGLGICACPDQVANAGQSCGNQPVVASCQPGTKCLEGVCGAECDPTLAYACTYPAQCQAASGGNYCVTVPASSGGGGGTGGGTGGAGGGSGHRGGGAGGSGGGGKVTSQGCGCATFDAPFLFAPFLWWRRRSAGATGRPGASDRPPEAT